MATVVFDFDSTLVGCESLEEIVAEALATDPSTAERYRRITEEGMSGGWSFHDSLRARLELAAPTLDRVRTFGAGAGAHWTEGMPELVRELHDGGHQVWIVSGAPIEVLLAAGAGLSIAPSRIRGVRLRWDASGAFVSVDPADPFSISKVEGLAGATESWPRPRIMVGDGRTDRAVFEGGLVDVFIPFTLHVRRTEILSDDIPEARTVAELREILTTHL